jgi:hypothetical protein
MSPHNLQRKIFFSHSSDDNSIVTRIADFMKELGIPIWYDESDIGWGDSFVDEVNQGLDLSSNLVVFLSNAAVSSPWVKREINAGLIKQLSDRNARVLPVKLEDCPVPALLREIEWVSLTKTHCYREGLSKMVSVLAPENEMHNIMTRFDDIFPKFFPEAIVEVEESTGWVSCPNCGGPALSSYTEQKDAPVSFKFYRGIQCEQCGKLFVEHEPEYCESCKIPMRWTNEGSSEGAYGSYEQDYAWECPKCGWVKLGPYPR